MVVGLLTIVIDDPYSILFINQIRNVLLDLKLVNGYLIGRIR